MNTTTPLMTTSELLGFLIEAIEDLAIAYGDEYGCSFKSRADAVGWALVHNAEYHRAYEEAQHYRSLLLKEWP